MIEAGLGKTENELLLDYLTKVGPKLGLGEEIRRDPRPRPDGARGESNRTIKTWQEAHEVLLEIETLRTSTRAFAQHSGGQRLYVGGQWSAPRPMALTNGPLVSPQGAQSSKGKNKGGKGGGKGKAHPYDLPTTTYDLRPTTCDARPTTYDLQPTPYDL